MPWFPHLRLKWKFVILVSSALAAATALILVLAPNRVKVLGEEALAQKGAVVAAMTASNLAPAMVFDDSIQVAEELDRVFVSDDILYAFVEGTDGRIIASRTGAKVPGGEVFARPEDPAVVEARAPVVHQGKLLGYVHVGFSRRSTEELYSSVRTRTTIVGLLVMIAGIAFVIMVSSVVTRPLNTVKETALRIHAGEITRRTGLTGGDEVSQVGKAFDIMMDQLESANRNLEQRVIERTRELEEEIAERKLSDEKLRASLHEKEILLKEIHHRVKNNMQTICSMLNLQAGKISDPLLRDLFLESQARIRSMASVHERLYQSEKLAKIDFADYLQGMTRELVRAIRVEGVSIDVHCEQIFFPIDLAIPCGLIANELISNALKHAFGAAGQGMVRVEFKRGAGQSVELIVEDNGKGFPAGVDFRNMTSMGMTLVVALTEQINAAVDLQRGEGTRFRVVIPLLPS